MPQEDLCPQRVFALPVPCHLQDPACGTSGPARLCWGLVLPPHTRLSLPVDKKAPGLLVLGARGISNRRSQLGADTVGKLRTLSTLGTHLRPWRGAREVLDCLQVIGRKKKKK